MPPLGYDGNTKFAWVTTIADRTAPTITELGTGDDIEVYIVKDGFTPPSNRQAIPTGSIADQHDSESPGTHGGPVVLVGKRKLAGGSEQFYTLFVDGNVQGHLVVKTTDRIDWAEGDVVDVYSGTTHLPVFNQSQSNTEQRMTVTLHNENAPVIGAAIAAGV